METNPDSLGQVGKPQSFSFADFPTPHRIEQDFQVVVVVCRGGSGVWFWRHLLVDPPPADGSKTPWIQCKAAVSHSNDPGTTGQFVFF